MGLGSGSGSGLAHRSHALLESGLVDIGDPRPLGARHHDVTRARLVEEEGPLAWSGLGVGVGGLGVGVGVVRVRGRDRVRVRVRVSVRVRVRVRVRARVRVRVRVRVRARARARLGLEEQALAHEHAGAQGGHLHAVLDAAHLDTWAWGCSLCHVGLQGGHLHAALDAYGVAGCAPPRRGSARRRCPACLVRGRGRVRVRTGGALRDLVRGRGRG